LEKLQLDKNHSCWVVDDEVLPAPEGIECSKYVLLGLHGVQPYGFQNHRFHRIRYKIDIPPHVKAGDLGGWIESYANLSQEGRAVVLDEAHVWGDAVVKENALVSHGAYISEHAVICGHCEVTNAATVKGNAEIADTAEICDNAYVAGNAKIQGIAKICGRAEVTGDAIIDCYEVGRIEVRIKSESDVETMRYWLGTMNHDIQKNWEKGIK